MNYQNHYNKLIERAKNREISGYTEKHHIIPKCLGGSDDESNLVSLTAREHYIAHQLLVMIYPNNPSLVYAANMMTVGKNNTRVHNRQYGWLREKLQHINKTKVFTKTTRSKMSNSAKNREKITCVYCGTISTQVNHARWHGDNCKQSPLYDPNSRKQTKEQIQKSTEGLIKRIEKGLPTATCKWCKAVGYASVINATHNDYCKLNPNRKSRKAPIGEIKTCPHCNKQCGGANYTRWHGDNCKSNPLR